MYNPNGLFSLLQRTRPVSFRKDKPFSRLCQISRVMFVHEDGMFQGKPTTEAIFVGLVHLFSSISPTFASMENTDELFTRTELLVGHKAMEALRRQRVIVFGVGGVGSWCAESLVRSGIGRLTLVDNDRVCASNLNRQLMATTRTLGQPKAEALQRRLLDIHPEAAVDARVERYTAETCDTFALDAYDYVVDAIDSLDCKALLILRACESPARLVSSMGAARKMDPTRISVAEFWKVRGCPLAAALRHRFRRSGQLPARRFPCVYSEELLPNAGADSPDRLPEPGHPNGTIAHATAIFGFTLAGLIVQDVLRRADQAQHPS